MLEKECGLLTERREWPSPYEAGGQEWFQREGILEKSFGRQAGNWVTSIPGRKCHESKDMEAFHSILGTGTSLEGLELRERRGERARDNVGL